MLLLELRLLMLRAGKESRFVFEYPVFGYKNAMFSDMSTSFFHIFIFQIFIIQISSFFLPAGQSPQGPGSRLRTDLRDDCGCGGERPAA